MSCDECKVVRLQAEVQENGIIRDEHGWIIGRADDEWMRYQWQLLETGRCPLCGREVKYDSD